MESSTGESEEKFKPEKLEIDTSVSNNNTNSINDNDNNLNEEALIVSNKETKSEEGN